jgi:pimeloyl-ACP methyl ester carboxylesterase
MKQLLCLMALAVCAVLLPLTAQADGTEDLWQGSIETGGIKLHMVFHVVKAADGKSAGTLDVPDQGAKGIALLVKTNDREILKIEVPSLGGSFEGKLNREGREAVGTWRQGGGELPLTLTKGGKLIEVRRPQTPKPPFSYAIEDVVFDSVPGVKLAGTLTLPRNRTGRVPTVLLIAGSGPHGRNEVILMHEPFLVLADYLTRRGFGVLRYDKRGLGKSTGSYGQATTADFADDAEAGVAYLKTRKEVDGSKIGLIGHSEGGVIAPLIASRNKDVAFIVLMAGTGMNGEEILYRQSALIAKADGAQDDALAFNRSLQAKLFAVVREEKDPVAAKQRIKEVIDTMWAGLTEEQRTGLKSEAPLYAQGNAVLSPWMRYFLTYDPVPALQKVHCPVLALNGSKDLQVPPKEDLAAIGAALKAGGNTDYTLTELPNLNHLFQNCTTGSPTEYGDIEETIAPVALKTMGDWIAAHTRK